MTFLSNLFGQSNLIYIHTDKQQYYAGETVSGQVILSVVQPQHVDGIFLKLRGCEETEFDVVRHRQVPDPTKENPNRTCTESYTVRVSDRHTFFKRRYCIYSQKCTLAGGNFVFPFQFQLESRLPGTFEIYNSKRYSRYLAASVAYQVEAEVAIPGMLRPNLYHTQDILINEPLRAALMASETYQEQKVTFMCCIPRGTITLSANIDKNAYGPGEVAQLRLIVDNSQSTVNLEGCSLKLQRMLRVHARGESYTDSGTVVKATSPGVKAGERAERFIQLVLPQDSEPSTTSSLVECSYVLSADLKVPWSPDVVCKQNIQIFAPQRPTYISTLQYPTNWAPNMMPMSDLSTMQYTSY
jgi:hypothetical protein